MRLDLSLKTNLTQQRTAILPRVHNMPRRRALSWSFFADASNRPPAGVFLLPFSHLPPRAQPFGRQQQHASVIQALSIHLYKYTISSQTNRVVLPPNPWASQAKSLRCSSLGGPERTRNFAFLARIALEKSLVAALFF